MRTLFKNPRTMLATATTSAALITGVGVAAVYAFGSDTTTVVRQVTVSGDAQPAADSSSSVAAIYKRSQCSSSCTTSPVAVKPAFSGTRPCGSPPPPQH